MFDLISVGDCMIDHFFKIHDAHVALSVKKEIKELCINYGDKIAVDEYHQLVAGNNANNAVGSARLGMKTAAYINVGEDIGGQRVIKKLKEEQVDTRYVVVNKGMESNSSAVITFRGERTILVYHQPWKYNLPDLDNCKWVYFSSVSYSFSNSNLLDQLASYVERTNSRLAFNPGTYQLKFGVKKMTKLLPLVTILLVNKQEAELILGVEGKDLTVKRLLGSLVDLGPKMVVMTNGKDGSYGFDGEKYYKLTIFPANLVEMTGAGDAYSTGFVAGIFYGYTVAEAMRWGAANGASVVEQIGPQAGLLTYEAMQKKLKDNTKIQAKEI